MYKYALTMPAAYLGKPGADVLGQWAVDGRPGHAVAQVAKALKPGLSFAHALEGGRVAGFHVNRYNVRGVVVEGVPETPMAMLQAAFLCCVEEIDGRGLPGVALFGNHTRGVVLSEDPFG